MKPVERYAVNFLEDENRYFLAFYHIAILNINYYLSQTRARGRGQRSGGLKIFDTKIEYLFI